MQLYGFWRSLATYRVRIVLNLKGIAVPEIPIDLDRGEQDAPGFRRVNPAGAVPALVLTDGTVLTQSLAIIEWLDEWETIPKLMPTDPLARARSRALCLITAADTHPLVVPRIQKVLGGHMDEAARLEWNRHWFTEGLHAYEKQVGDAPFCCGEEAGLADACLASHIAGAQRFGVDLEPFPVVRAIHERCMAMPDFARAHPLKQQGAPAA